GGRSCGGEGRAARASEQPAGTERPRFPKQRYAIDERLKRGTTRVDPKRRPSLWAKIGGALAPSELRPGRPGQRETMVREYANVRKYQEDVDRLVRAG